MTGQELNRKPRNTPPQDDVDEFLSRWKEPAPSPPRPPSTTVRTPPPQQRTAVNDRQVGLDEWDDLVADRFQVPRSLMKAIRNQESGGNVNAVSPTGVRGRYQMTEATARSYGLDRNDPFQQSVAAAKHLRNLYDASQGGNDDERWLAASAKYYGGPNAVQNGRVSNVSLDGISNPARYVEGIAKKWGELRRAERGQQPQDDVDEFLSRWKEPQAAASRPVNAGIFAPGAKPKPAPLSRPSNLPTRPEFDFRANQGAQLLGNAAKLTGQISPEVQAQTAARDADLARRRAEYERKGVFGRRATDVYQGMANLGAQAQQGFENVLTGTGVRSALNLSDTAKAQLEKGRAAREYTAQEMAANQAAQDSLSSKLTRGVTQAAGGATMMAPVAMVGGVPAVMAATGLQQDWDRDPKGAALNTALSGLPIVAGKAVSPVAQRVAGAVRPGLQKATQLAVEGGAGGLAGAGQYAGTQALLGREIDPEETLVQGLTGAGMAGAMAPKLRPQQRPTAQNAINARSAQHSAALGPKPAAPPAEAAAASLPSAKPERSNFSPNATGRLEYMNALDQWEQAQKATPTPQPQAAPTPKGKAKLDSDSLRQQVTLLQTEASEAEQAGNYVVARTKYKAAQDVLGEMRRQAKTAGDAEGFARLGEEIQATAANGQLAGGAGRKASAAKPGAVSRTPQTAVENAPTAEAAPLLQPGAVVNPEGGVPLTPEQTPTGRLLQGIRRDHANREAVTPGKRIISRIAELGGLNMEKHGGEMQAAKDARRVGLLRREGVSPDIMARMLREEGYNVDPENLNTLWDAINRDVAGHERPANTADLDQRLADEEAAYYENRPPTAQFRDEQPRQPSQPLGEFRPDTADLAEVRAYGRSEPEYTQEPPTGRLIEPEAEPTPARLRPPAPTGPRMVGNRPAPLGVNLSARFPSARRALAQAGEPIQAAIEAGQGERGPHGRAAQMMFKSGNPDVLHGQDSFFHDAELKGKLGLSRDASMADVRGALKQQLARMLRLKADEVSLTQIAPDTWRRFADVKGLGRTSRAKLETALQRAQGRENVTTQAANARAEGSSQPVPKPPAPTGELPAGAEPVQPVTSDGVELSARSSKPVRTMSLSGDAANRRHVRLTWENAPQGTEFSYPLHHGNAKNVLLDVMLEDRNTTKGERALFLSEAQSDWHQRKGNPAAPYKNNWLAKSLEYAAQEGKAKGYDGVLLPKTAGQVNEIQHWEGVTERNGRYYNVGGTDVTAVIRRYVKELPDLATRAARKEGTRLETREVQTANGKQELYYLPLKKGQAKVQPTAAETPQPSARSAPSTQTAIEMLRRLRSQPVPELPEMQADAVRAERPAMELPAASGDRLARLKAAAERAKPKFVEDAEQRLNETASGLRAGSGAEALFDAAVVAGHRVYKAGMEFAQWAREVVRVVGEQVRPHLKAAWEKLRAHSSFGEVPESRGGTVLGMGLGGVQGRKPSAPKQPMPVPAEFDYRQWTRDALALAKAKKLSGRDDVRLNQALDRMEAAIAANDGDALLSARDDAARVLQRSTALEKLSAARKAAMLSKPTTHMRNIIGNTAFQVAEEAARVPGSMADVLMSGLTGRRSLQGLSLEASQKAIYKAATDGLKAAKETMRGRDAGALGALQSSREVTFKTPIIDKAVKTVFRSLDAEDKVFFTGAYERAIREQARLSAVNEARRGQISKADVAARTLEHLQNPTAEMELNATAAANLAVFRNDNKISGAIKAAREQIGGGGNFALDLVLPFDKTPTNIVLRALEYSPAGAVGAAGKGLAATGRTVAGTARNLREGMPTRRAISEAINEALPADQQRRIAQLIGRTTTGSAGLMALGYALAAKGAMTGFYDEDDPKGEAIRRATGAQPLAVKVGGRWYGVSGIAPLGYLMGLGATLYQETSKPGGDAARGLAKGAYEMTTEMPLLKSAQDTGKSIEMIRKDRGNVGRAVGRIGSSFIPGIVGDVGQLIPGVRDPYERDTRAARGVKGLEKAQTEFLRELGGRVPGVRKMLPIKRDANGRPVETEWTDFVDPFKSRAARGALPRPRVRQ